MIIAEADEPVVAVAIVAAEYEKERGEKPRGIALGRSAWKRLCRSCFVRFAGVERLRRARIYDVRVRESLTLPRNAIVVEEWS